MGIIVCHEKCEHLRSLRYGFAGKTRVVGTSYDRRDKDATCALRPEVTIAIKSQPECVAQRELSDRAKG